MFLRFPLKLLSVNSLHIRNHTNGFIFIRTPIMFFIQSLFIKNKYPRYKNIFNFILNYGDKMPLNFIEVRVWKSRYAVQVVFEQKNIKFQEVYKFVAS